MTTTTTTAGNGQHPNLAQPQKKAKTIGDVLQDQQTKQRFAAVLPRHLSPERMLRVCTLAVYKTPKLAECDVMSLLGAMMVCASLGLEPNTPLGAAYLIPFNKNVKNDETGRWEKRVDVNLIIGYRGFIDLARRSGGLVSLHADVVYEGDEFDFHYGTEMKLIHRPIGVRENRKPLWAYAYATLQDGQAFEVLPYGQVLKIRDKSQGYTTALQYKNDGERGAKSFEANPWVAFEHEMAAKTMVRRLAKMLPLSIEFANAAQLDAMSESGSVDFRSFSDAASNALVDVSLAERPAIEHSDEQPMGDQAQEGAGQQQEGDKAPVQPQQPADPKPKGNRRKADAPQADNTQQQQQQQTKPAQAQENIFGPQA